MGFALLQWNSIETDGKILKLRFKGIRNFEIAKNSTAYRQSVSPSNKQTLPLAGTISRNFHFNELQSFLGIQFDRGTHLQLKEAASACQPTIRGEAG